MPGNWKISIDTGGTFTDCIAFPPDGHLKRLKVLSSGVLRLGIDKFTGPYSFSIHLPFGLRSTFLEGFTIRIHDVNYTITNIDTNTGEIVTDKKILRKGTTAELTTGEEVPVFACRLLTGTSLNQPFPEIELRLGSTRGTNALLERKGSRTALIITKGFKDLLLIGDQQRPALFALNIRKQAPLYHSVIEVDERIESDGSILRSLTETEIQRVIEFLMHGKIKSVAIAFVNSYCNPQHEVMLKSALNKAGFGFVSSSQSLSPHIKILPRAETSVVNAYLDPIIHTYIERIKIGIGSERFDLMASSGGLLGASAFLPKDSLLSGPAGGVMGALRKAIQSGAEKIITFDMGGTSTDVSLCNKRPEYRSECAVGNLKILSPSIAIETIAAGGGSICSFDGFRLTVGPESAGAFPGPAAYGMGGPLTITDVNLLLGRLDEENFSIPINVSRAEARLKDLLKKTGKKGTQRDQQSVLEAFVRIANEKMAEAIRKVSIQQGYDPREYALLCFGGAGGQHACALASMIGVSKIIVPYDAGLLSAYGIAHAAHEKVMDMPVLKFLSEEAENLERMFQKLFHDGAKTVQESGTASGNLIATARFIFLRLKGQETSLEIDYKENINIRDEFISRYKKVYGHWVEGREIEIESIRLIIAAKSDERKTQTGCQIKYKPKPLKFKNIYTGNKWENCPVYRWEQLDPGAFVAGPALLVSDNSTFFVEATWSADLDENENMVLVKKKFADKRRKGMRYLEEAELELFTNRFTAIARNMGALLQRTAFSVNIKERLDFSCALLDARGNLIVNAPHIPVHLGSLGVCVRELVRKFKMKNGDVIITNDPAYGGSHLPDITLVKPVYFRKKLLGFAANRAHHAEIGGKKPGSMPAEATCLEEEGVVIHPCYLVEHGEAQWNTIEKILTSGKYPSRSVRENLADLNGALASLHIGEQALAELAENFGHARIAYYMEKLSEQSHELLKKSLSTLSRNTFKAIEFLDDGHPLKVSIKRTGRKLEIDFNGSSPVHHGNMNATTAIVQSVVLYVLRLLVNENIPLNEGLLRSVKLNIPSDCILNPSFHDDSKNSPAVVGGNTEISQRLTDTLLKAFGLSACSQGTMNNFLFGNDRFGYYETICGGTGAGPGFDGTDAVHQHMTNTRITDPEILEFRYPVRLERFEIRRGSGGKGKWRGGDGVVREFYFKEALDINILSQHRKEKPYGMKGGMPGKTGEQFIIQSNGRRKKLRGVDGVSVSAGDRFVIETPGGGGWGKVR